MTGQSLKLGKFMADQVTNTFGHVRWLSIISALDFEARLMGNIFKISNENRVHKLSTTTKLQNGIGFASWKFFSLFSYKILKETCIMWAHKLHFVILIKKFLKIFLKRFLVHLLKSGALKSFLIKENTEKQK